MADDLTQPTPPATPPAVPTISNQELLSALEAERRRNNELEAARQETEIRSALSATIAASGRPLSAAAADQLAQLLRPKVKLIHDGGKQVVVGPELAPIDQFIAKALDSAEYAHFVRASNPQGGTGGAGAQYGAAGGFAPTPPPEAQFVAALQANPAMSEGEKLAVAGGLGLLGKDKPRRAIAPNSLDPSKPFGLGRLDS